MCARYLFPSKKLPPFTEGEKKLLNTGEGLFVHVEHAITLLE